MKNKSKIIILLWSVLITFSVSASYYRFVILDEFTVFAEIVCDPIIESCFVKECEPYSEDCDSKNKYFKLVFKNASNLPICVSGDVQCDVLGCFDGELECREVLCSENTLTKYAPTAACVGYFQ